MLVSVLREMRIGFEHQDRLAADHRRPERAKPLLFDGRRAVAHRARERGEIVGVGHVVVFGILARRQDATERVAFVYGPGDDEDVDLRQGPLPGAWGFARRLRRKPAWPRYIGEAAEPGCGGKGEERGALGAFRVKIDDVALNIIQTGIRSRGGLVGVYGGRGRGLQRVEANVPLHPRAVDDHGAHP
jgi:hypothetical protein